MPLVVMVLICVLVCRGFVVGSVGVDVDVVFV